jgi:hypothetical protein
MNQHDQNTSPGYPGTDAPQPEESDESASDQSFGERAREFVSDLFGGTTEKAAENNPELLDPGVDSLERRDLGLGTADVIEDPYQGSADSRALDRASSEIPGRDAPPDSALYPLDLNEDSASDPAE